jgi:outer membrane protein assembly factor BamB
LYSSPAVANGVVYVGSDDGTLYAFDAAGGTNCGGAPKICFPLWSATTGGPVFSSPAVGPDSGRNRVRRRRQPQVYGQDLHAAVERPKRKWRNGLTRGRQRAVYIASSDSKAYAFGLEKLPPTTSVVRPSNGATLSGTAALVASASDDVSVSKVEFHLTGGSYNDLLIGTAVAYFGWDYNWNTTSVPNGTYTLNSVAYDPAENVGRSTNVTVNLAN